MAVHGLPEPGLRCAKKGGSNVTPGRHRNRSRAGPGRPPRGKPDPASGRNPTEESARGHLSQMPVRPQLQGNQRSHQAFRYQRRIPHSFRRARHPQTDDAGNLEEDVMNNPQINPDDPKWTAYVLGELDEAGRVEIERLLETSDEARALVEELNLAAMTLKEELAPLSALAMTPEQKAVIRAAAAPAPSLWSSFFPGWAALAAAAAVVLVTTTLVMRHEPQGQ